MKPGWTDEEVESVLKSMLLAIIVASILYYLFIPGRRRNAGGGGGEPRRRLQQPYQEQQQRTVRQVRQPPQNHTGNDEDDEGISAFLKKQARYPPHHLNYHSSSEPSAPSTLVVNQHHDGILPFRATKASQLTSNKVHSKTNTIRGDNNLSVQLPSSKALEHRKDRARLFAKIFASSNITPPGRGGTLVVSIPSNKLCPGSPTFSISIAKIQKTLFLLGSFYNLFVMVSLDEKKHLEGESSPASTQNSINKYVQDKERSQQMVNMLYSSSRSLSPTKDDGHDEEPTLSKDVLPPHRIIMTESVMSRIAFVRSFPKSPDYIIGVDDDNELLLQLTKFGFKVILMNSPSILGK